MKSYPSLPLYTTEPHGNYSEQIRTLRSGLSRLIRADKRHLLITSSWPGEGKTLTLWNLAPAFAELGVSLLLVDFGEEHRLSGLLGMASDCLDGSLYSCSFERVKVMRLGRASRGKGSDYELSSPAGRGRLKACWAPFDLVLIDAPSLSASREVLAFGGLVDGALMVVSRRHFRGVVEGHHSEDLRDSGMELLGSVVCD